MPLITKPNYNQIFASQAPEQDKPAVFNNYPEGWGPESRPNNGKPTIKGFNYLQQTSDLKDLWILQNGACLPYDESIEYAEGAPVLKDGVIQYKTAGGFKSRDSVTVPTYNDAADGVDPVTGVANGAYFNVRSPSDESYVDEYQNVGGNAVATGKRYLSALGVQLQEKPASTIKDESGKNQQEINNWLPLPTIDGAKGDGVNDDTDALQAYINKYRYVNLRGKNWKISRKLTIPSYRVIDLSGANLTANNGTDPIFEMQQAGEGLTIIQGGGAIFGTADSFLKCTGSTTTPTNVGHYARQIRLDGLYIASTTIDKFLDFKDAVRQVFIDKVHAFTKNGISAVGKCVEVFVTKSIIYGAINEVGTYGIKLQSPGGTSFYNEGFHFTDCTIDNFNTTFDVTDIYALSVTGGHIGRSQNSSSVVAKFGQPTSTHCRDIKFTGVNINGRIEFAPTGGKDYAAQFTGCVSESCNGINIHIKNNAAGISIANHRFVGSTSGLAVVCDNNNANISISDIVCDITFVAGVQIKGANGRNCSVANISYDGSGDPFYAERAVLVKGVPVSTPAMVGRLQTFNTGSIQGSHIAGANIASVNNWFAKGETGVIVCELTYTGASASQVLAITTPVGMSIPSGTGWSSGAIILNTVDGRVSLAIPYIVTQDIPSGSITLKNDTGNTISLGYHSYFGFKRDW